VSKGWEGCKIYSNRWRVETEAEREVKKEEVRKRRRKASREGKDSLCHKRRRIFQHMRACLLNG